MIAFARECPNEQAAPPAWHDGFCKLLPAIRSQLRFCLRKLSPSERAEALSECIANITIAYARLHEQNRLEVAFASSLVAFAVKQYFSGRRVGTNLNIDDIGSPYCQRE